LPVSSKFLTGLLLLISLAGCSDSARESKVAPKAAFPVEIFTVGNQSAERKINAVGTVRYRRETPLGFTTAGKVAVVRFAVRYWLRSTRRMLART
jgi:membrane fusion protein (multidrug efflux system)